MGDRGPAGKEVGVHRAGTDRVVGAPSFVLQEGRETPDPWGSCGTSSTSTTQWADRPPRELRARQRLCTFTRGEPSFNPAASSGGLCIRVITRGQPLRRSGP